MFNLNRLTLTAGNSRKLDLILLDYDEGGPLPLTGCKVRWVLNKTVTGSNLIYKDTDTGGIVTTDAEGGLCTVSLNPDDTKDMAAGEYYCEAEVEDSFGNINTVFSLPVTIKSSGIK